MSVRDLKYGMNSMRAPRFEPIVRVENKKNYFDKSEEASPHGMGMKSRAQLNREKIQDEIAWFNKGTTSVLSFFMETVEDHNLKRVTDNVTQFIEQFVSLKPTNKSIIDIMNDKKGAMTEEDERQELRDLSTLKAFELYREMDHSIRKHNVAFDTARCLYILGDALFNRRDNNNKTGLNALIDGGFLTDEEVRILKNAGTSNSPLYARGAILLGYIDTLNVLLNIFAREYTNNKEDDMRFAEIPRVAMDTILAPELEEDIVNCQLRIKNTWKNSGLLPKDTDIDSWGSAQDIPAQKIRAAIWSNNPNFAKKVAESSEWKDPIEDNRFGSKMIFDSVGGVNTNFKFKDEKKFTTLPAANSSNQPAYRPGVDGLRTNMPAKGTIIAKSHFNYNWRPTDPELMVYELDNGNQIIFDPFHQKWEEQKFENQMRSLPQYNHSNAPVNRKKPTGIPEDFRGVKLSPMGFAPVRTADNLRAANNGRVYNPNSPTGGLGRQTQGQSNTQGSFGHPSAQSGIYRENSSRGPVPLNRGGYSNTPTPAHRGVEPQFNIKTNYTMGDGYDIDGIQAIYIVGDVFYDINNKFYCNDRGQYFDEQERIRNILVNNGVMKANEMYPGEMSSNTNNNVGYSNSNNYSNTGYNYDTPRDTRTVTNDRWVDTGGFNRGYSTDNRYKNPYNTMGEFRYTEPQRNDEIEWSTAEHPVVQNKTIHLKGIYS